MHRILSYSKETGEPVADLSKESQGEIRRPQEMDIKAKNNIEDQEECEEETADSEKGAKEKGTSKLQDEEKYTPLESRRPVKLKQENKKIASGSKRKRAPKQVDKHTPQTPNEFSTHPTPGIKSKKTKLTSKGEEKNNSKITSFFKPTIPNLIQINKNEDPTN